MNIYNENQKAVNKNNTEVKSKKSKLIAILVVVLVLLIGGILLYKHFTGNSSENISISNASGNKNNFKYDIKLNGKKYTLPMKLTDFMGKEFYYNDESVYTKGFNPYHKETFWQRISLTSPEIPWYNDNYVSIPDAGYDSFVNDLSVMLVHKANTDKTDEKKYTVVGFSVINTAKDFFTLNNVGCGDSIQSFIDNLNIDINSEYVTKNKDKDGNISYLKYWDEKNNITIEILTPIIGDKKDGVYEIKIYLVDTEKYS